MTGFSARAYVPLVNRTLWATYVSALGLAIVSAACARSMQMGPSLPDPDAVASRALSESGAAHPSRVRFRWEYGDSNGTLRGDGVGRINPPDSFRLDFFTIAEGSMAAVLAAGNLSTLGEMEDLELPEPTFLYAMAGVFRPGRGAPTRGFTSDGHDVLVYEGETDASRFFFFRGDRLVRLEERRGNRVSRRIRLEWEPGQAWPARAEYRDNLTPSRAEWELVELREVTDRWPREIYELGPG